MGETDHLGPEDVQSAEVGLRTFNAQLWSPLRLCRGEGRGSTSHVTFFIPVIPFKSNSSQMEEGETRKVRWRAWEKAPAANGSWPETSYRTWWWNNIDDSRPGRRGGMYTYVCARVSKVQQWRSAIIDNETVTIPYPVPMRRWGGRGQQERGRERERGLVTSLERSPLAQLREEGEGLHVRKQHQGREKFLFLPENWMPIGSPLFVKPLITQGELLLT